MRGRPFVGSYSALCVWQRRKITFAQFQEAVKLLAEKKYPGDPEAVDKLKAKIFEGKGPAAHGVTVSYIVIGL